MRQRTSGNTCARPISPTACSRPTPTFLMPVRKLGRSSSTRPEESPPSQRAIGQSSIKQFEGWYNLRNDGDSVAAGGEGRSEAWLDGRLDGALRPDDRRGKEVRRVEHPGAGGWDTELVRGDH